MRPLEIGLSLSNVLAFLIFVVPGLRVLRGLGILAFVPLLVTAFQVILEGPRWQMVPAYGLAAVFGLIGLLSVRVPVSPLAAGIGTAAGALLLVIALALPVLLPVFRFSKPSGPYAIGTLTYDWVDTTRLEIFTADPNDHRALMVQVWYPARALPAAPRAAYLPDAEAVTPAMANMLHAPRYLLSHLKYVTTHAVTAAPIAEDQASYPVLIYLTGLGGFRSASTSQIEALVSHGYIVVGLDQPGGAAGMRYPDGRQITGWTKPELVSFIEQSIVPQSPAPVLNGVPMPEGIAPYFAQDASFVLDQLALINQSDPRQILSGHLDLSQAGVFGISLGGMNAAEACYRDPRLKACLIMDVYIPADVLQGGLNKPTMLITRDEETILLERERSGGWADNEIRLTLDTMRQLYADLPPGDGYYLSIPGMFHVNFLDVPAWTPIASRLGITGPIDGQRGFDILNAYMVAFFDNKLKGLPSPLLDGPSEEYREVQFEKR